MNFFKYLLPLVMAVGFSSAANASSSSSSSSSSSDFHRDSSLSLSDFHSSSSEAQQDSFDYNKDLNERDWDALREFINTKRTIDLQEKGTNLAISGDVRTEWRHLTEKSRGVRLRGPGAEDPFSHLPISKNDFDIELNLRFDYVCKNAWAVAHLQFDNSAGVDDGLSCPFDPEGYHGSGRSDDIDLKRAYWGYNLYSACGTRFDIEIGRRRMYDCFDSEVQFLSRFDGILLKLNHNWECVADLYWKGAVFLVDERVNHMGYVTEIGALNIMDAGIDLKYSFIHWNKYGINRCFVNNPFGMKFQVSQITFKYHLDPDILNEPAELFAAFLYNHDRHKTYPQFLRDRVAVARAKSDRKPNDLARKMALVNAERALHQFAEKSKNQNLGFYIGFIVGDVVKEGDWSFEMQYQYVQASLAPDDDFGGIGRGNVLGESFTSTGRGNGNFKGYRFEGLYALTDNLSLDTIIEWSRAIKNSLGGSHHYSKFELEAIYAF